MMREEVFMELEKEGDLLAILILKKTTKTIEARRKIKSLLFNYPKQST